MNGFVLIGSCVLVYLFFSKDYRFPRLYIALAVVPLVVVPVESVLMNAVLPAGEYWDAETIRDFARSVLAFAIWVPYMLVSKRVRVTFIQNAPVEKQPQVNPYRDR